MENVVMDAEGSLHQKPRDACITKDTASIDLEWFENTKLNRVKNGTRCLLQVGVCDWESLGASLSMIQKGFCETVAEVMDAEAEGEDEIHPSKRHRVAERFPRHVPPEVEPENRDFDVNEFLQSNPNPLVLASVFGNTGTIRRAAVRRGYPVMKSRFLNFGDDVHDQSVRERIVATVQRIQPRLLRCGISKPRIVANLQLRHFSSSERADRQRTCGRVGNLGSGGFPVRSTGNS